MSNTQKLLVEVEKHLDTDAQSHPLEGGQKLPILDEAACPFCKIFKGEIGRNVIVAKAKAGTFGPQQTNDILAIEDLHPHFEQHLLIIPQLHAPTCFADLDQSSLPLLRSLRAFSRTLISDPDLEGFHSFPSIYHLHLHVTKGRPTFPGAKEKFLPAKTVEDCFLRPFPIEDYLCHFATFDLVERVLTQDKDLKQLQGLTARRSRLHPIDRLLPAYAHLFEVADEKETDFTKVVELFDGGK